VVKRMKDCPQVVLVVNLVLGRPLALPFLSSVVSRRSQNLGSDTWSVANKENALQMSLSGMMAPLCFQDSVPIPIPIIAPPPPRLPLIRPERPMACVG
jgi:hypothetical protein